MPGTTALLMSVTMLPGLAGVQVDPRFESSIVLGATTTEIRVADAVVRADGQWLTLGSRFDETTRETPYLLPRLADGSQRTIIGLDFDETRSYQARSLVLVDGSDVIVLSIEYDLFDPAADRSLIINRFNSDMDLIWSGRIGHDGLSFETVKARLDLDGTLMVYGEVVRTVKGVRDNGDGVLVKVNVVNGALMSAHTIGTPAGHERIVDLRPGTAAGSWVLLIEMFRQGAKTVERADALLALDSDNAITDTTLIAHDTAPNIGIQPLHLLPKAAGGWIVAGRRSAFGPNVFYLHAVDADLTPDDSRVLIPFFNEMDTAMNGNDIWLYGESNGESTDAGNLPAGSAIMRFDTSLALQMQRRYGTENPIFPRGAIAFSDGNALLSLGAVRQEKEGELVAYELAHLIDVSTGEGLLCNESDYKGFVPFTEATTTLATAWTPVVQAVNLTASAAVTHLSPIAGSDAGACAISDEIIFASGFEQAP